MHLERKSKRKWQNEELARIQNIQKLLSSLQNHMFAYYSNILDGNNAKVFINMDMLGKHLIEVFTHAIQIFNKAKQLVEMHPNSLELIYNLLLNSVGGSMLFKVFVSLLLLNDGDFVEGLLERLLDLLNAIDSFNQLLPADVLLDSDRDLSRKYCDTSTTEGI